MKFTTSLCPECYSKIPAKIEIGAAVVMDKTCPEHGTFTAIVETSPEFYRFVHSLPDRSIYNGLLVDITGECNLSCAVCFHDNKGGPLDPGAVITYCREHSDLGPFLLSGGEPTLHPALFEIIGGCREFGEVVILTNGVKLTDLEYLRKLAAALGEGDFLPVAYSIHPEAPIKEKVIGNFRIIGKKLPVVLWVITSLEDIQDLVIFFRINSDVVCQIRIKAAANVWGTDHIGSKLFVSDIIKELSKFGNVQIDTTRGNKSTCVNLTLDGLPLMVISWFDKHNIDLEDIDCPPYYKSSDGVIRDLLSAFIFNERGSE